MRDGKFLLSRRDPRYIPHGPSSRIHPDFLIIAGSYPGWSRLPFLPVLLHQQLATVTHMQHHLDNIEPF